MLPDKDGDAKLDSEEESEDTDPRFIPANSPGWIVRSPRDSRLLGGGDVDFRELFGPESVKEANACCWYEYARECAAIRSVAATFTRHKGLEVGEWKLRRKPRTDPDVPAEPEPAWFRIDRLLNQLPVQIEKLAAGYSEEYADRFGIRWRRRLQSARNAVQAFEEAQVWLARIQANASLGAPCFSMVAEALGEDRPWLSFSQGFRMSVLDRLPRADSEFDHFGTGRHPIAGLLGGLELEKGFSTVSPQPAFSGLCAEDGGRFPDGGTWTEVQQIDDFRSELFVGRIVWNRTDTEIVNAFETWLKAQRLLQPPPFNKMGKRDKRTLWDDPASGLKCLAALRLRASEGPTVGARKWGELYATQNASESFAKGILERTVREEAKGARDRFMQWMPDWVLDSDVKGK